MKVTDKRVILGCEDRDWAHAISSFLVPAGFIVHTAVCGNSVIGMLKKLNYDIAILAMNLPGKNGLQVLEEIEKIENKPIIVMSCRENFKYNIREFLMNGAYLCVWNTLGGEGFQILCNKLLERKLQYNLAWGNVCCPFYRSASIKCPISEGIKDLSGLLTVFEKCISNNFYECSDYRELSKQRNDYSGVERRKFVRIDTDIPMRYEVCGEAGVKYASVRDISERALRYEAKHRIADHAIISAGLQIPGEENISHVMGRGIRTEKVKHSDRYNIVMMYQLIDKQDRKAIKNYIKNATISTKPNKSLIHKIRDAIKT